MLGMVVTYYKTKYLNVSVYSFLNALLYCNSKDQFFTFNILELGTSTKNQANLRGYKWRLAYKLTKNNSLIRLPNSIDLKEFPVSRKNSPSKNNNV